MASHVETLARERHSRVRLAGDRECGYYTGEVLAPIGGETLPG